MKSESDVSSTPPTRKSLTYAPPVLRILFVIDGRFRLVHGELEFGLGYALDTLSVPSWNARIEVAIATREASISDDARDGREVRYCGFKFTQPDFDIDAWDQIWFFADQPNKDDGGPGDTDADIKPPYILDDDEALILAEWMDRGGGVFATGDHGVLGASLCHRIPRVRTMRRWRITDGVPPLEGSNHNQTWQGENPSYDSEGDLLLQPIELVNTPVVHSIPFLFLTRPHPLLCSDLGPIDHFPDHMHEGELVPDDEVDLDRALDIPGYTRPEYPVAVPEILASAIDDISVALPRPRPHIIAYGKTTHARYIEVTPELSGDAIAFAFPGRLPPKRYGLVSVYDGDLVGLGRVVCDSTWHHWLSINLHGIAEANNADYRKIQAYYRNIALWLARPEQRRAMSLAAVWGVLTLSGPMAFSGRYSPWDLGERALTLLGGWLAPCWINELVAAQVNATSLYRARRAGESDSFTPAWDRLPEELINRAVLGAMCHALKPLAADVRRAQTLRNDLEVDPKEIERLAARGVAAVPTIIRESLDIAIEALSTLRHRVAAAEERASSAY
jgi:hypothetical protein